MKCESAIVITNTPHLRIGDAGMQSYVQLSAQDHACVRVYQYSLLTDILAYATTRLSVADAPERFN